MWILHICSCFCPSDMNLFYTNMSSMGYDLAESNYFSDRFSKNPSTNNSYFVIPKAYCESLDDLTIPGAWESLSANSNFFILVNRNKDASETPVMPKLRKNSDLSYLLKILLLPICLYFIVKNMVGIHTPSWQLLAMTGMAILIWLGFAWSSYMEASEMNHYMLYGSMLPQNNIRYFFSMALLVLSNLSIVLLAIMILRFLFL